MNRYDFLFLILVVAEVFLVSSCLLYHIYKPSIVLCDPNISYFFVNVNVNETRVKEMVKKIIDIYSLSFGFGLKYPLHFYVADKLDIPAAAYTYFDGEKIIVKTKYVNMHVFAHELVHVFQFSRWGRKVYSFSEKYEWFIEGFADAVPVYLFHTTPLFYAKHIDSCNGIVGEYPPPWTDPLSSKKKYVARIFFLYLFRIDFKDVLKRYWGVEDAGVNPFHQMYPSFRDRQRVLAGFWLNHTDYIDRYSLFLYRPIRYSGAETITISSKYYNYSYVEVELNSTEYIAVYYVEARFFDLKETLIYVDGKTSMVKYTPYREYRFMIRNLHRVWDTPLWMWLKHIEFTVKMVTIINLDNATVNIVIKR